MNRENIERARRGREGGRGGGREESELRKQRESS